MQPSAEHHPAPLKVVIRHPMRTWADALERLLAPRRDIEVVTSQTSSSWVHHAVVNERADILLTFLDGAGEQLETELEELFAENEGLGVVVLSDSRDQEVLCGAVRAGVRGWVEPTASLDHLVRVLHGVARGETWFPPALLTALLQSLLDDRGGSEEVNPALSALSAREREVLACLVQGMSRAAIADQLSLSPHTVRTHINNLLRKLDVHSTLAAVSVARQAGLSGWASVP